ncbi:hypothetical protein B0H14DRAFT_2604156 [Mycena olivaceomarginata]|nr:hypothetical protein B0H14DRAFT_2604156 [Mycena olivaceomarginata]
MSRSKVEDSDEKEWLLSPEEEPALPQRDSVLCQNDNQVHPMFTKIPDPSLPVNHLARMSSKHKLGFGIVHSGTWWKDFHAAQRERQARAANGFSPNVPNSLTGTIYMFVPGQDAPIVTVAGAPVRPLRKSALSVSAAKIAKTKCAYVAASGSNTILATRAQEEKQGHICMARAGYLGDTQNFVALTDEEILAYLKTLRGRELLAVPHEQSTRLAQECRQTAIAAALPARRIPHP